MIPPLLDSLADAQQSQTRTLFPQKVFLPSPCHADSLQCLVSSLFALALPRPGGEPHRAGDREHLQGYVCTKVYHLTRVCECWGMYAHIRVWSQTSPPQTPAICLGQISLFSSPHRGTLLDPWGSGSLQSFQAVNSTSGFLLIPNILISSGNAMSSL